MKWSRGLEAFAAMVRSVLPRLDYQACYFAKVVAFNFDRQQVDLVPDDPRFPGMQGIPLRGFPGAVFDLRDPVTGQVADGITMLVGWEDANPARPFALGFGVGARVPSVTLNADQLFLGGEDGAEPPPKGTTYRAAEDALNKARAVAIAAVGAGLSSLGYTGAAVAVAADAAAQTAFDGAAASYLATNAKVK